jgi:hypothetical protein
VLSVLITIGSFNFLYLSKKKIIKTKRQDWRGKNDCILLLKEKRYLTNF